MLAYRGRNRHRSRQEGNGCARRALASPMPLRFTIRDLLWLTFVVALALGRFLQARI